MDSCYLLLQSSKKTHFAHETSNIKVLLKWGHSGAYRKLGTTVKFFS